MVRGDAFTPQIVCFLRDFDESNLLVKALNCITAIQNGTIQARGSPAIEKVPDKLATKATASEVRLNADESQMIQLQRELT